jgi:putative hydrolase of the HAD superfamily
VKYRAVFFDAGETLVHPHPSFPELFTSLVEEAGYTVEPDRFREGGELVAEHFARAAREGLLWSTSPQRSREFWLDVYRLFLERLGVHPADGLAEKLYREFTTLSNYRLFEDVAPALERLDAAGLTLGLVSNFEAWLERLLHSLDVMGYFDAVVISGVEGMEKPDPRIFQLALERGGVEAEDSVYVGDNPVFDTEPAEALGMLGVLLDRRDRFPDHTGVRIRTLEELPAAIGLEPAGRER